MLRHKYFPGTRIICLDSDPTSKKGSHIFTLCMKALLNFKEKLFWIPGNVKHVKICQDSILGKPPISILPGIKGWLDIQNKIMLWDISSWDPVPPHRWISWSLLDCPMEIDGEKKLFLEHLVGAAPLAIRAKDKHTWGRIMGEYSSTQRYDLFVACLKW